ncbi:MAG: hypothetical protein IJK51_07615 [Bacteroidaceae bacterium]|nr:hypothetical protein [Bacteroidaceae bacterium]
MNRYTLFILALFAVISCRAQNQDLENLLKRYRNNPAIVYEDLLGSFHKSPSLKVSENFDFNDSVYLVRHFIEEYQQIKGYKKLKPSKVLDISSNFFMKMALNKAIAIRLWEYEDGYKDAVIEFDGCRYIIIHVGGFYKIEDLREFIKISHQPHKAAQGSKGKEKR